MTPWTAHQLDYCVGLMKNHGDTGIPQAALARYLERFLLDAGGLYRTAAHPAANRPDSKPARAPVMLLLHDYCITFGEMRRMS